MIVSLICILLLFMYVQTHYRERAIHDLSHWATPMSTVLVVSCDCISPMHSSSFILLLYHHTRLYLPRCLYHRGWGLNRLVLGLFCHIVFDLDFHLALRLVLHHHLNWYLVTLFDLLYGLFLL